MKNETGVQISHKERKKNPKGETGQKENYDDKREHIL